MSADGSIRNGLSFGGYRNTQTGKTKLVSTKANAHAYRVTREGTKEVPNPELLAK